MLTRRGFTLVELVVGIALATVLGGAVTAVMVQGARRAFALRSALAREEALRSTLRLLRHELEPIDPTADELVLTGDSTLQLTAVRGTAVVCERRGSTIVAGDVSVARRPVAGRDALLTYADDDESRGDDDRWLEGAFGAVTDASCPGGAPALAFDFGAPVSAAIRLGAPILIREPLELRRYVSGGLTWFGARALATGETVQPVAGPFAAVAGLVFSGHDAARAPASGRLIAQLLLAARTTEGGGADSLTASVETRGVPW